jgi:hypothetical protein
LAGRIEAPLWRPQTAKENIMTTPTHTCFTVCDRGEDRKPFWVDIGSAWVNKDGSFNLRLDALPVNGQITVRIRKANENSKAKAA